MHGSINNFVVSFKILGVVEIKMLSYHLTYNLLQTFTIKGILKLHNIRQIDIHNNKDYAKYQEKRTVSCDSILIVFVFFFQTTVYC